MVLSFILPTYSRQDRNVVYKVALDKFGYTTQQHDKPSVGDVLINTTGRTPDVYIKVSGNARENILIK